MEILIDGFAAAACCAGNLTITGNGSVATPVQLVIAALVVRLVVVVSTCFVGLIARVPTVLLVRMPSVLTMHVVGRKTLSLGMGGPFFLPVS